VGPDADQRARLSDQRSLGDDLPGRRDHADHAAFNLVGDGVRDALDPNLRSNA